MQTFKLPRAAAAVLLAFHAVTAFSWTRPGHMVSAEIAYDDLSVADSRIIDAIAEIMAHHPDPGPFQVANGRATGAERTQRIFMEMSRWPDDIREGFQDHPTWHYAFRPFVDPKDPPKPRPVDVISGAAFPALALNINVASDPHASSSERAVSLCWIFHIVGDIHQPLHAAQLFSSRYPNGDHGGGAQHVLDPQTHQPEIFHWFWDDSVNRLGEPDAAIARARDLEQHLPRAKLTELSHDPRQVANITGWASESYILATTLAFRTELAPTPTQAKPLPEDYVAASEAAAERRLVIAGYRLADLLRSLFPQAPPKP